MKLLLTEGEDEALTSETKGASKNSSSTQKPSWVGFITLPLINSKYLFVVSSFYLLERGGVNHLHAGGFLKNYYVHMNLY